MLNVTFTGNIFLDNNLSDCNYQIHYQRQNVWTKVLNTEFNQYNSNAGDSTIEELGLGQDEELKINDIIILAFFKGTSREDISEPFCSINIVYDGSTTLYVNDIILKDIQLPTLLDWNVTDGTINNPILASSDTELESQWIENNTTYYQRRFFYGVEVFPTLIPKSIEYNFEAGYNILDNHTYTVYGIYDVKYKFILPNDEFVEDIKQVKITLNKPTVLIEPNQTLVQVGTDLITNFTITDIDDTIVNDVSYNLNDNIVTTSDLTFTYTDNITTWEPNNYLILVAFNWNDGFDDLIENSMLELPYANTAPTVDLTLEPIDANEYKLNFTYDEIDDEVQEFKYQIFYKLPFSNNYVLDLEEAYNTDEKQTYIFNESGDYKIRLELTDTENNIGFDEEELNVACSGVGDTGMSFNYTGFRVSNIKRMDFSISSSVGNRVGTPCNL